MNRTINKLKDNKKKVLNQNMTSENMQDVILDDAPATGGKKNKKKRGKAADPNQNGGNNQDVEKMAEEFNVNVNKEMEEIKAEWEKEKF